MDQIKQTLDNGETALVKLPDKNGKNGSLTIGNEEIITEKKFNRLSKKPLFLDQDSKAVFDYLVGTGISTAEEIDSLPSEKRVIIEHALINFNSKNENKMWATAAGISNKKFKKLQGDVEENFKERLTDEILNYIEKDTLERFGTDQETTGQQRKLLKENEEDSNGEEQSVSSWVWEKAKLTWDWVSWGAGEAKAVVDLIDELMDKNLIRDGVERFHPNSKSPSIQGIPLNNDPTIISPKRKVIQIELKNQFPNKSNKELNALITRVDRPNVETVYTTTSLDGNKLAKNSSKWRQLWTTTEWIQNKSEVITKNFGRLANIGTIYEIQKDIRSGDKYISVIADTLIFAGSLIGAYMKAPKLIIGAAAAGLTKTVVDATTDLTKDATYFNNREIIATNLGEAALAAKAEQNGVDGVSELLIKDKPVHKDNLLPIPIGTDSSGPSPITPSTITTEEGPAGGDADGGSSNTTADGDTATDDTDTTADGDTATDDTDTTADGDTATDDTDTTADGDTATDDTNTTTDNNNILTSGWVTQTSGPKLSGSSTNASYYYGSIGCPPSILSPSQYVDPLTGQVLWTEGDTSFYVLDHIEYSGKTGTATIEVTGPDDITQSKTIKNGVGEYKFGPFPIPSPGDNPKYEDYSWPTIEFEISLNSKDDQIVSVVDGPMGSTYSGEIDFTFYHRNYNSPCFGDSGWSGLA